MLPDPEICLTNPPWQAVHRDHHIYCHIALDELRKIDPVVSIKEANHAG